MIKRKELRNYKFDIQTTFLEIHLICKKNRKLNNYTTIQLVDQTEKYNNINRPLNKSKLNSSTKTYS